MSLVCKSQPPQQQPPRRLPPAMNVTNAEQVLKNYCKAKGYEKPRYRITSRASTMLDGKVFRFKHYVCRVTVSGFSLAEGEGFSKRIARKKAAMDGLAQLRVLELQDFWAVYQTILPASGDQQRKTQQLMVTTSTITSGVEIEELLPTGGMVTPYSVAAPQRKPNNRKQSQSTQQQLESADEDPADVKLRSRSGRERTLSADSSNELISAAIEKLKSYSNDDDDDDAGWTRKEEEEEDKAKKKKKKLKEVFSEEEMHLFNEGPASLVIDTDLQDIIVEAALQMEVIEERDDNGMMDNFDL
ncbi:hypothetical protein TYRP_017441 [Tyrophagus putrescentiae]|nr:hypothetical protein TYRP_017441 [Tyrophagus putrescentiae]